jgi:membrane protease YdiL (CAAX protease family)
MYLSSAFQGRNEWWRYVAAILIIVLTQIIGSLPVVVIVLLKQIKESAGVQSFIKTYNFEAIGISQNSGLLLLLLPSFLCFFVLLLLMVSIHKKKLGSIASVEGKIRWGHILSGAGLWLILLIVFELVSGLIHRGNYEFNFSLSKFLPLLVIAIIIIPFQSGFEELLFRSYLMQGTVLLFRLRIVALLLTSIGFGLLHVTNPEAKEFGFWMVMPYYIGFGIFAGLLVIMDNGIELAMGTHIINNIYGAVLVTYKSSVLQTPALWKMKIFDPLLMNAGFIIMAIVFLVIMARIYNWSQWQRIFMKIERVP